ncbi:MAG: UbiD family decarboxylase [Planctomycetota bacterium]
MGYRNLRECLADLERGQRLVRVAEPVSATLEAAEIQRRVYRRGGPAILFENVPRCRFPMVSNLFGTVERARYLFRHTLPHVRQLIALRLDPNQFWRQPFRSLRSLPTAAHMRPRRRSRGPVLAQALTINQLPQLKSWPDDGGPFITLPQVYSEDLDRPGLKYSNLGMYRVQLSGGQYARNREVGLHYQLHRGIGCHHAGAIRKHQPLPVNIFVGGTPAMSLAAVLPLPEGMSELTFAGALAGHRIPMVCRPGKLPVYGEADFCIQGTIDPHRLLPEGPFGDHLGYYSLAHDFPVLHVERVSCRKDAIWPFTVVGRPPQEDSVLGQLIHELTAPMVPAVIPGVHAVHAVDAAGVHPLLLAIGTERYVPYERRRPRELLTQANAVLGQGQMSLAKYLLIVDHQDDPRLDVDDVAAFLRHLLCRVDWRRDAHFQTRTTIDTLDYSGTAINEGSKVAWAAAGPSHRVLPTELPGELQLPEGFSRPKICLAGVLAIQGPPYEGPDPMVRFCQAFTADSPISQFPLIVVVDDSEFTARTLDNFLWVTFTRSDPAADTHGIESFTWQKHWGCNGALVLDARVKPRHAPPLIENPEVTRKIDAMATRGGSLARFL